jgi:hypothetical protein
MRKEDESGPSQTNPIVIAQSPWFHTLPSPRYPERRERKKGVESLPFLFPFSFTLFLGT